MNFKFGIFGKKKKKNLIKSYMITKSGKLIPIQSEINNRGTFDYENGTYIIDKDSRLLDETNTPTYIHFEGISPPLNVKEIEEEVLYNEELVKDPKGEWKQKVKKKVIKINATNFKSILGAKLFDELFRGTEVLPWKELTFDILILVNTILAIITAIKVYGIDALLAQS